MSASSIPGIIIQKLFDRRACGEEIEDQGHPETVPFDAGLAKTNRGINGNPREQLFPGHGRLPHVLLPWKVRRPCQSDGAGASVQTRAGAEIEIECHRGPIF